MGDSFNAEDYYGPQRWSHFTYKSDDDGRTYCETTKLEVCESGTPRYEIDYNDEGEPIVTKVGEDDTLWIDPVSKRTFHDNEVSYSSDPFDKPMVYQKEDVIDEGEELPLFDVPSSMYDAISSGEGVAYEPATHMTPEELKINGYRNWKIKDIIFTAIRFSKRRAIEKVLQELEKENNCLREEDKDYLRYILKDKDIELSGRIKRLLMVANKMGDKGFRMSRKEAARLYWSLKARIENKHQPKRVGVYSNPIRKKSDEEIRIAFLRPKSNLPQGHALKWKVEKDLILEVEHFYLWKDKFRSEIGRNLDKNTNWTVVDLLQIYPSMSFRKQKSSWIDKEKAIQWIAKYSFLFEGSN